MGWKYSWDLWEKGAYESSHEVVLEDFLKDQIVDNASLTYLSKGQQVTTLEIKQIYITNI